MVSGGGTYGLAIDSVRQFGLFNEDKVESAVLGIIVIVVLSWLTLTAYTLFREPKLLKHWNYTNLGLLGAIALFGISSFLVVSLFILFILQLHLPDLLPALVLSDESVYSDFFTYAFVTQGYMILILVYRKLLGKTPSNGMVPAVVAKIIKFNFSSALIIIGVGSALFMVKQGELGVLLFMVWFGIGLWFLRTYLSGLIQVIRLFKHLKTNSKFSPRSIQIINRLFLLSVLLAGNTLYGKWNIVYIGMVAIALFTHIVGPEKIRFYLKSIFADRVIDGLLAVIGVVFIIKSFPITGELRLFNFTTGVMLLGGSVIYLFSLKLARDFVNAKAREVRRQLRI